MVEDEGRHRGLGVHHEALGQAQTDLLGPEQIEQRALVGEVGASGIAEGDADPAVALGLSTLDFDLVQWNADRSLYEVVSTINPGQGYWLNLATGKTINLVNSHPVSTAGAFEIKLKKGWNQIGNPFLLGIPWSQVNVLDTESTQLLPVEQAADGQHQ